MLFRFTPERSSIPRRECTLLIEHSNEEGAMLNRGVANQILEIVKAHPGCGLDELTSLLPDFSWSEIFVEVDRMSRAGQLRLTRTGSEFLARVHAV